jgi:N-(2-amino-2-carboxyethyl)-L-glutamate synthase
MPTTAEQRTMMVKEGVLSAIGGTPLVRLTRVMPNLSFNLFAKLEYLNPGGSIKDRPAMDIITQAIKSGDIRPGTVVVESSSGNMGIGIAQVCSYYGLKFICVVDPKTLEQNIRLLKGYGAEVDVVTEPDPETGEFLQARIERVKSLVSSIENSFWPDQYSNLYNSQAHHRTMREISEALDGRVGRLFCATSTCGTLRGCAEYARNSLTQTKVIAVDAIGSIIFGGPNRKRLIPGHGASIRPQLFQDGLADGHVLVSDQDCVIGCRRLARREALLCGGSSGGVLMAVDRLRHQIPAGSNCVILLADRGERYLDTIYSDEWVHQHFGELALLWEHQEPQIWVTAGS